MDNCEGTHRILELFAKSTTEDIPLELEYYLELVAKTGESIFNWFLIKRLILVKFEQILNEFIRNGNHLLIGLNRNMPVFDLQLSKGYVIEKINKFNGTPFTIQRICELLTTSRKEYLRIDKFIRAFEKNILVVSTTAQLSRHRDNGQESILNGMEMEYDDSESKNEVSDSSSEDLINLNFSANDQTNNNGAIIDDQQHPLWPKIERNNLHPASDLNMIIDSPTDSLPLPLIHLSLPLTHPIQLEMTPFATDIVMSTPEQSKPYTNDVQNMLIDFGDSSGSAEITESKEQNVEDGYCFEEIRQKVEFLVDVVAKQAEQDNASDNINCEVKFNQNGAVNHV